MLQILQSCRVMRSVLIGWVRVFVPLGLAILVGNCSAADLTEATGRVAKRVADYLRAHDQESISITPFFAPSQLASSAGPGIVQEFTTHFERQGITVRAGAATTLQGRFHLDKDEHQQGRVAITIRGSLVDRFGEVLTDFSFATESTEVSRQSQDADAVDGGEFDVRVDHVNDVVKSLGLNTSLHAEDTDRDRQKDLLQSLEQPTIKLAADFTQVLANDFGVEILVGDQPRQVTLRDGRPFISLRRGESYAVRVTNNASHETAAEIAIDGINSFAFAGQSIDGKTDHPSDLPPGLGEQKFRHYLVPPKRRTTVRGWHLSLTEMSLFEITPFEKSAAGKLGHERDSVGTITVSFSAAWPKDGQPPRDESMVGRSVQDATGFGATVGQEARPVQREIGRLRASISIRYDL